jgi:CDP-diacylglycerol--serine O-phosphatidyltransferase
MMQKQKQEKKQIPVSESGHRGKRRLKYIAIFPSIITLTNAVCGFLSILLASRGEGVFWKATFFHPAFSFFAVSAYLIFFAMIADMFDGKVARLTGAASDFGGQLDSLSDTISFGVAPAFLMFKVMETYFVSHPEQPFRPVALVTQWILFIAIVYVLCTVIRLARFNVENDTDESAHMKFSGLPSPAAAGIIMSLVILQEDFLPKIADRFSVIFESIIFITTWALPVVTLTVALLMVTRVKYPHLPNMVLRGRKPFFTFFLVVFIGLFCVWNIEIALFIGFWGFAIAGFIHALYSESRRRKDARNRGPEEVIRKEKAE